MDCTTCTYVKENLASTNLLLGHTHLNNTNDCRDQMVAVERSSGVVGGEGARRGEGGQGRTVARNADLQFPQRIKTLLCL